MLTRQSGSRRGDGGVELRDFTRGVSFEAVDAPLMVVDTGLVIRDVNRAFLDATERCPDDLVDVPLTEAFPDNPADVRSTSGRQVRLAFEAVFERVDRYQMPMFRHDIPGSGGDRATFVRRHWTSVTTRLQDRSGRVIGAVCHAEDVTSVAEALAAASPSGLRLDAESWSHLLTALAREARGHERAARTAEQLLVALDSRVVIEEAKGFIAARSGIGVDEAFARLRQHARSTNSRLQETARAVIERGLAL